MARSSIETLPVDIREWLESELVQGGFSDYRGLTTKLNEKLGAAGEGTVSKSALHRFGRTIEERIEEIRERTAMMRVLLREVDDKEGALNDGVQRLLTSKMIELSYDLDVNLDDNDSVTRFHKIVDAASKIGRVQIDQKKWQEKVAAKAAVVAESVAKQATKAGLSADVTERIRREILGVAG